MKEFKNKIITITGGTGSFGSTFAKRLLKSNINEVRIISRDEKKQDDLRKELKDERLRLFIGDVRDKQSIYQAIKGSDYVFHAAALKQVPSCEFFPIEAVKTNVMGANNVMMSAIENKVKKCVVLSTDKAVYPINAMGMTKALMEKCMIANSKLSDKTTLCATRYGNVMASRGSVIPLFFSQMKNNQNVTITNPDMTRFLMSLEDSVDLVLYAFKNAMPGDIFVQKSPAATVITIAKALEKILGVNAKYKNIGTRHGEKLYESLVSKEEMIKSKSFKNFFKIPADERDLNYENYFVKGSNDLESVAEYNSHNTKRLNIDEVVSLLLNKKILDNGF